MLILFTILILLLTSIAMVVVQIVKLRFAFHWFIAASGALAAWSLVIIAGSDLPQIVPLVTWQPQELLSVSPTLLLDRFSWSYAQALVTLLVAVILTGTIRVTNVDWLSWISHPVLIALGIFAVVAGNLITLLLAWMALDFFELVVLLSRINQSNLREKVVVTFSARTFSSLLVILAAILATAQGQDLSFTNIPDQPSIVLLLAAGFRLGVIPIYIPFMRAFPSSPGMGTILQLSAAAAGLFLLVRIAPNLQNTNLTTIFIGLASIATVYSGITWLFAKNESEGRPAWIVGMASLSLASAAQGQAMASLSWGLSGLLGGGLLFLFSKRNRWVIWLPLVGLMAISALPYTPNWNGAILFSGPINVFYIPLLFGHSLLLLGYARHALRTQIEFEEDERWSQIIYPLGLLLLLGTLFSLGLLISPAIQAVPLLGWFAGAIGLGIAALLFKSSSGWKDIPPAWVVVINSIISFQWLYKSLWTIYRSITRMIGVFTRLLEGEGGVLWAVLLMGLLYSLLTRLN
jgi:hypothetical protein